MTPIAGKNVAYRVVNDYTEEELFCADTARDCLEWMKNEISNGGYTRLRCWVDKERGVTLYDIGWGIMRVEEINDN